MPIPTSKAHIKYSFLSFIKVNAELMEIKDRHVIEFISNNI